MPKNVGYPNTAGEVKKNKKKKGTTAELQERTFPAKVAAVQKSTAKVIPRGSGATVKERGKAQSAQAAANRVAKRMGLPQVVTKIDAPSSADVVQPGKTGKGRKKSRKSPFDIRPSLGEVAIPKNG